VVKLCIFIQVLQRKSGEGVDIYTGIAEKRL